MDTQDIESVFENHRWVKEYHKVSNSDEACRYTVETYLDTYNDYMFDYDWLDIKEIVVRQEGVSESFAWEDERGWFLKHVLRVPEGQYPAMTFVVEVVA